MAVIKIKLAKVVIVLKKIIFMLIKIKSRKINTKTTLPGRVSIKRKTANET